MHLCVPRNSVSTVGSDGPEASCSSLLKAVSKHNRFVGLPPVSSTSPISWKAPSVFVPSLPLVPKTPSSQLQAVLAKKKKTENISYNLKLPKELMPSLSHQVIPQANPNGKNLHFTVFHFSGWGCISGACSFVLICLLPLINCQPHEACRKGR